MPAWLLHLAINLSAEIFAGSENRSVSEHHDGLWAESKTCGTIRRTRAKSDTKLLFLEVDNGSPPGIIPSEIGITGLKIVLGTGVSQIRRTCWIIVLIASAILTLIQGVNRFQNYENPPVTVSIRVKPNASLPFPDMTICPQMTSSRHLLNPKKLEILWRKTFPGRAFPTGDRPVLEQLGFRGTLESFLGYNTRRDDNPNVQQEAYEQKGLVTYGIDEDVPKNKSLFWTRQQRSIMVASAFLAQSLGVKELWNTTSYIDDGVFDRCYLGRGVHCYQRGKIERAMTVSGKCMTYRADRVRQGGMYHGLMMILDPTNVTESDRTSVSNQGTPTSSQQLPFAWSVLLHGRGQSPATASFTHGYYVESQGMEKAIAATLRTFEAHNTAKKPCRENSTACTLKAYERILANLTNCRLPFMTMSNNYSECKSALDYLRATVVAIDILEGNIPGENGGRMDWGQDSVCPQPCYRELFEMQSDTSTYSGQGSVVRVYFPDMSFEEIVEEVNYGIIPLLCDFGGTLGLLMGASVLTMVEIIEAVLAKFLTCLCIRELKAPSKDPGRQNVKASMVLTADAFYEKRATGQLEAPTGNDSNKY